MKQRNAFTTDNSPGLSEPERKHANTLFDAWARDNPFHGNDIKGWQQRAGEAQKCFVEAIVSQRVPAETTAAARAPARVPIASQAPKPPLLPGQAVGDHAGERDPSKWPDGSQYPPSGAESVSVGPGDVAEVDPNTLRPKA